MYQELSELMDKDILIRLISEKDIINSGCINYKSVSNVIKNALLSYKKGNILLPDKTSQIFDEKIQNRINCMPSTLLDKKICGVKWVSVFPNNPSNFSVPNVSGLIILSEIEKGLPIAIMDGTLITSLRTACMGAVAATYLARKDSKVYGTIGAGNQAQMHFRCIKEAFPNINKCYVSSRTLHSEEEFISIMKPLYPDVEFIVCNSNYKKASINADILVTAVSCQEPILKGDYIKKGTFYCHVGGWEDDFDVPAKADKIVCDDWESVKHRGSPTIARMYEQNLLTDKYIYSNIVDIIDGTKSGRENNDEFIYFNSIGLSYIDVSVAFDFYKKVCENKLGKFWKMIE